MSVEDIADDLSLLAKTPIQAESLLYSLEQRVGGIGLYENANQTDFRCFKQEGIISLRDKPLKLVVQFIYSDYKEIWCFW